MRSLAAVLAAALASTALAEGGGGLIPLADNSFLIEEAYNQEGGVVQQIGTFTRDRASGAWVASFTQEWPAPDQTHQLSYTLNYGEAGAGGGGTTFGDILLNYRYQAASEEHLAFSPRLTAVIPGGTSAAGTGYRGFGVQTNLPVSTRLASWLVAHSNFGFTWVPAGKAGGQSAEWLSWAACQSFILEPTSRFNIMLEAQFVSTERKVGGVTSKEDALLLSPGVRWGFDLPAETQVVLGLAVPFGVGPSAGESALFAYISVELPFWHPSPADAGTD